MAKKKYVGDSRLRELLSLLYIEFSKKVNKETGKGLSANDYTTTEKNKLAGIEAGAQVNPTIDSALSDSSTNAVQNKIVKAALDGKADSEEIPTVNNNTITIQLNGTTIESFTLNQATDETINIQVTKSSVGLGSVPNVATNDQTPTFTQASTRANIASGEKLSVIFGKIMKWFADLKTVAFTGSYSDLSNQPPIPTKVSQLTNDSGFITSYTDTKNTAGTTNTTSKIFLAGATSQAANPQTYSNVNCYASGGKLYSNAKEVVNLSDSQSLTNKTYNGYTLAAACAKDIETTLANDGKLPTGSAVIDYLNSNLGQILGIYIKTIYTDRGTSISFTLKTFMRAGILFFGGKNGSAAIGCIGIEPLEYGGHGLSYWTYGASAASVTTNMLTVTVSESTVTVSGLEAWSRFTLISPLEFA